MRFQRFIAGLPLREVFFIGGCAMRRAIRHSLRKAPFKQRLLSLALLAALRISA